jgi:hypothetical protein
LIGLNSQLIILILLAKNNYLIYKILALPTDFIKPKSLDGQRGIYKANKILSHKNQLFTLLNLLHSKYKWIRPFDQYFSMKQNL